MLLTLCDLFLKFLIVSFIGYIVEVTLCSYDKKKWVNRGFLFGPIIPIWGVGGMLAILSLSSYRENPILIFIISMLITGIVEYFTSYILEKIFNNKWWDYSKRIDNINGRVRISNLIGFAIGCVIFIYIVDPFLNNILNAFLPSLKIILTVILFILFLIDLIASSMIAYSLRNKLIVAEELKKDKIKLLPSLLENKYRDQIVKIRFKTNRLIKIYPNLTTGLNQELGFISKVIDKYKIPKRKNK